MMKVEPSGRKMRDDIVFMNISPRWGNKAQMSQSEKRIGEFSVADSRWTIGVQLDHEKRKARKNTQKKHEASWKRKEKKVTELSPKVIDYFFYFIDQFFFLNVIIDIPVEYPCLHSPQSPPPPASPERRPVNDQSQSAHNQGTVPVERLKWGTQRACARCSNNRSLMDEEKGSREKNESE